MPDVILTIDDFNKIFQNQVLIALGLSEAALAWKAWKAAGNPAGEPLNPFSMVRVGWMPGGAPAWKISDNICFVKCVEIDDPINRQHDKEYTPATSETANEATSYTRVFSISFVLYGPSSYDNSQKIKNSLFKAENRHILAASNVFMIPNISAATRFPELFQGQWWERTDLTIPFNNLVIINDIVNYIGSAEIVLSDNNIQTTSIINGFESIEFSMIEEHNVLLVSEEGLNPNLANDEHKAVLLS